MILLQPVRTEAGKYMEAARRYKMGFELMDLAFAAGLPGAADRARQCYDHKFLYSCHGVFADLNYSGSDPWIYEMSEKRIRQCIETGQELGIGKFVFHSCFHPVLQPDDPLYDEWSQTFARLFCGLADEYGVDFYIENVMDLTPLILEKMMRAADHSNIHVCLDVGHANFTGSSLDHWLERLHPYISYFHLSDNMGRYDDHMAVGEGNVDFRLLKEFIQRYEMKADYTLEVTGLDAVEKSVQALKQIFGEEFFHAGQ